MDEKKGLFRYGIACALEQLPERQPVILRGEIQAIAKQVKDIGYDAIELHLKNPREYDGKLLKKAAADNGIGFSAIATGMEYTVNGLSLISDDPEARRAAVDRLKEHIDLCAQLDCALIVGIMRGNIPDFSKYMRYEGYLTQALVELSDYARGSGVQIVFEAIMRYINNYLCNVPETVDYLDGLGQDNVRIHIDTHLMNVEDKDMRHAVRCCRGKLGYVHFSDSNRRYPGGGSVDFLSVMQELAAIGYNGYVVMECVPWPDGQTCARRALRYVKALEECIAVKSAE
ncbi:sugar phosphate isomerase/epimerase [Christensenellaceae bacterium OttesenSCG-928-K19]|nr:sugar phosphate isomerase/epimerase [Christensenellaceae bacterium OttesenSCG-928-K19]